MSGSGNSLSCHSNNLLVFCNSFDEGGDLSSIFNVAGSVVISEEKSFSGQYSAKVSALGGGYNRNYLSLNLKDSGLSDGFYGRMLLWVDEPGNNGGDFTFAQAEGDAKPVSGAPAGTQVFYRYRVAGDTAHAGTLMANYDTRIDSNGDGETEWLTDCWDHSATVLPRETWSCVEWHFDARNNRLSYWLNGRRLEDLYVAKAGEGCLGSVQNNAWLAPKSFITLHLGIEQYHPTAPPRKIYIDDVALDNQYIGCPSGVSTN
ncbi:MAG: hypothetical protein KTR17_03805 [Cellvibrionaceae bacterium]|nr:hypothetical protein [Cellvibrionaceae bacterium]